MAFSHIAIAASARRRKGWRSDGMERSGMMSEAPRSLHRQSRAKRL